MAAAVTYDAAAHQIHPERREPTCRMPRITAIETADQTVHESRLKEIRRRVVADSHSC